MNMMTVKRGWELGALCALLLTLSKCGVDRSDQPGRGGASGGGGAGGRDSSRSGAGGMAGAVNGQAGDGDRAGASEAGAGGIADGPEAGSGGAVEVGASGSSDGVGSHGHYDASGWWAPEPEARGDCEHAPFRMFATPAPYESGPYVSDDGCVVTLQAKGPKGQSAIYRLNQNGWHQLNPLTAQLFGVSANGDRALGSFYPNAETGSRGFLWSATEGLLPFDPPALPTVISSEGTRFVGKGGGGIFIFSVAQSLRWLGLPANQFDPTAPYVPDDFTLLAANFDASVVYARATRIDATTHRATKATQLFRWTDETGFVPVLPTDASPGACLLVSSDGSTIVTCPSSNSYLVWKWNGDSLVLSEVQPPAGGQVSAISADGSTFVGQSGPVPFATRGASNGTVETKWFSQSADPSQPADVPRTAWSVSADGRHVAGGMAIDGGIWLADFP